MNLLPGLHLPGGGRLGPGLTNPYDCNVYLIIAGLTRAIRAGIYPPGYRFPPAAGVRDPARLLAGLTEIRTEALPTPGHSRDHICYLVDAGQHRYALSGELVFARGRIALLGTDDADIPALHNSLGQLRSRRPRCCYPGMACQCWPTPAGIWTRRCMNSS